MLRYDYLRHATLVTFVDNIAFRHCRNFVFAVTIDMR